MASLSPKMAALKRMADAQGISADPMAVYKLASQMGVSGNDVDRTFGLDLGTSNAWTKANGLGDLMQNGANTYGLTSADYTAAGSQPPGQAGVPMAQQSGGMPDQSNPYMMGGGNHQEKQFMAAVQANNVSQNPQAVYQLAQQYGISGTQVDSLFKLNPGTSDSWVQSNRLRPLGSPSYGGSPQQPGQGANPYLQGQQQPQQQNPYMANYGNPMSSNPALGWMANSIGQQVGQNLQRNILPGIRSAASAAGGLGGSRQGIAEGIAIGDTMTGYGNTLAGLYGNQYNADRNYGLANDALDLNVWQANQGAMRNGQLDQIGFGQQMLGMNQQYGIGNATNVQNTPMNYYTQFSNSAQGLGGMGGNQSQTMPGNPYLGALGGAQLGNSIYNQYNKPSSNTANQYSQFYDKNNLGYGE